MRAAGCHFVRSGGSAAAECGFAGLISRVIQGMRSAFFLHKNRLR